MVEFRITPQLMPPGRHPNGARDRKFKYERKRSAVVCRRPGSRQREKDHLARTVASFMTNYYFLELLKNNT
ncbi:hypothetical protein J6590_104461, partial [Homalodisca vitripennis]